MESVFGLVSNGFAVVAADTSATSSILIHKNNEDKVMVLNSHKLLGASGEPGDRAQFTEYIQKNVHLYQFRRRSQTPAAPAPPPVYPRADPAYASIAAWPCLQRRTPQRRPLPLLPSLCDSQLRRRTQVMRYVSTLLEISEEELAETFLSTCERSGTMKRLIYTGSVTAASPLDVQGLLSRDFIDESC